MLQFGRFKGLDWGIRFPVQYVARGSLTSQRLVVDNGHNELIPHTA
jgi:hypothetical protein